MKQTIQNIRNKIRAHPFISLLTATILTIATGTIFYHFAEGLRWLDSLYFSVVTLTTVGYGDFSPQTDLGKIFTIFYIINGIGIIFGYINAVYGRRTSKYKAKDS